MPTQTALRARVTNTHTTMIEAAEYVVNITRLVTGISKITLGQISPTTHACRGGMRVKFQDVNGGILMTVRDVRCIQLIWVYTDNIQSVRTAIARALRNKDVHICFKDKGPTE